jgi:hypothetical protein
MAILDPLRRVLNDACRLQDVQRTSPFKDFSKKHFGAVDSGATIPRINGLDRNLRLDASNCRDAS